jgi:hypothetical protein
MNALKTNIIQYRVKEYLIGEAERLHDVTNDE